MVVTYSPHHHDVGGALHFPSPTHIHHVDATSAIRQLRRSLSRSPSRGPTFRLVTSASPSPTPKSPLSPSPLSPSNTTSANIFSSFAVTSTSPLAVPFPPSAKKNRPCARRPSPMRMSARSRASPKSPMKRALSDSTDNGNGTPSSPASPGTGVENRATRSASPTEKLKLGRVTRGAGLVSSEATLAPHHALSRLERVNGGANTAKSSPLKRSDGIMDLDQASLGSPLAKRRSMHGASFGADFNIFDYENATSGRADQGGNSDGPDIEQSGPSQGANTQECSPFSSPMPKRSSSLRKTTLQQRCSEKPTFAKSKPNTDLALELSTPGHAVSKTRHRMSLENFLPSMARDSPFSSQGTLPSASVHVMSQQNSGSHNASGQPLHQPHPLSRTITQSSSNSAMTDDSPTHAPPRPVFHHGEHPRVTLDFSKSLPAGVARPIKEELKSHQTSSGESSFTTPENYKLVKPLPAAFMSTGLISKRNKNMDEPHLLNKVMPDTPCKRPINFATVAVPVPGSAIGKARQVRHSFGTPSTPFNAHATNPGPGPFSKGVGIFGSSFGDGNIPRRGSFVSIEGEDSSQSPSGRGESQSSADCDFPPTPTKQPFGTGSVQNDGTHGIGWSKLRQEAGKRTFGTPSATPEGARPAKSEQNSKLSPFGTPAGSPDGDKQNIVDDSPSLPIRFESSRTSQPASFTKSRSLRSFRSPSSLSKKSLTVPSLLHSGRVAKPSPLSPASPLNGRYEQLSPHTPHTPHTPQESILPPDPSGLSISAHGEGNLVRQGTSSSRKASAFPPATPTASRECSVKFGGRRSSVAPFGGFVNIDVDASLTSRFQKVELIGSGEFSQVYRVTQPAESSSAHSYFSFSIITTASPKKTPLPDRVWAVKKTKHPYIGARDRQRKLQEVNILRALGRSDHTVELVDSWEEKDHLYMQLEFCEEGSLDAFLTRVGDKGRLDDFRIWKILLELSLGVQHIHQSGFIHLDLKPANVLITSEGVLRIADFGIATHWPARPGIEGEGDREYLAPEILIGQYDKPADIFALGLVMLEIAGNVVLPDNGVSWQKLRNGDTSDVPSLSWNSEASNIPRDASGNPLSSRGGSLEDFFGSDSGDDEFGSPKVFRQRHEGYNGAQIIHKHQPIRSGELSEPPSFMADINNEQSLDRVVRWMISPHAPDRPAARQLLETVGVHWAQTRRRAGATIFEGNWGPADEVLADDAEMMDV